MKTTSSLPKPSIHLTIFMVCFVLFNSCQEDATIEISENQEYQEQIETYQARIKTLEEELDKERSSDQKPANIIDLEQALKIYQEYNKRADLISETTNSSQVENRFEPTRSLFYDIAELRNYLAYIDNLSKQAGVKPTGLRFYFALYPASYISSEGSAINARHQTIFIAPTLEKKYNDRILNIGYTLDNKQEVILLDKNSGFSHLRRDRKASTNTKLLRKGSNKYSLIANELGATPPEWGGE